jgi:hypothetical protein
MALRFSSRIVATISVAVEVTLLAACGPAGRGTLPSSSGFAESLRSHQTFTYTGKPQRFTVPSNVTSLTVDVVAARGGGQSGGLGGRVLATIPVTSGETLAVYVGGQGTDATGGFNGGGNGGSYSAGYGGGGASDVREGGSKLRDRILIAGAGGGEGGGDYQYQPPGRGGSGGGRIGRSGGSGSLSFGQGGRGGTQHHGGSGGVAGGSGSNGTPGKSGYLGHGGSGGNGGGGFGGGGGGGGGGYYGGGGGGGGGSVDTSQNGNGGGGGGGSSYIEPRATAQHGWRGWKNATGNGVITFRWQ